MPLPEPKVQHDALGGLYLPLEVSDYARANLEPLLRERDALRNRLEDTVRDLTDAKAENERLRAQYQQAAESSEHFAARTERLEEALRELEEREQRDEALLRQALGRAHQTAMEQTLKARIPECAEFAGIAQDLDFVVAALRERLGVNA